MTSGTVSTEPLGSLIDRGYKPRESASDDEVWNLNLDQIEPHTGRVLSKCMLSASELGPSTYAFDRGTVLYSKLRPYLNKVLVADDNGVATTELVPLRCDESRLDAQYLAHFLRGPDFLRFATNVVAGAKMPRMVMSEFWTFPVPLPPLPEQRRIAAILDQADALRAKRREALAQLDSLTQSIFIEMFGDPGPNPKSWAELELGQLIVGTPNNGIFKKNEEYGAGTPVVWVEELFKGNEIDCSNSRALLASTRDKARYGLRNGDLLFCRSSLKLAGIGYNNVYLGEDDEALFECHVIRVSPNQKRIEPRFLNYALRLPSQRQKLFKFAKTVTMTTIDQDGLLKVSVPVPTLDLQREFCRYLAAVEVVRRRQMATVAELDALFASLQHRAFAGQLS
ncbi:MAG: restriction endonuclease subunit S [Rubrivivax sp.]|nr:restriction endonuclease subunit S [Rubrivivax sp.]